MPREGQALNHFAELLRHNAWANRAVLDAFRGAEHLLEQTAYDNDPLMERVRHFTATEEAFLDVIRRDPKYPTVPDTFEGLVAYCDRTGAAMLELVSAHDVAGLDEDYFVPWFKRSVPLATIVSQVLAHSGQHRAELAWELARAGISTGEIDFIVWKAGGEPAPGHKPDLPEDDD